MLSDLHRPIRRNGNLAQGFDVGTGNIFDPFKAVAKVVTAPIKAVTNVISKIPVAGDLINIANKQLTAPLSIASDLLSGKNIKDVAANALKGQIEYVQKTAPYVQAALPVLPPGAMQGLLEAGKKAIASTPALAKAVDSVTSAAQSQGFQLAAGLLNQVGVNEKLLTDVKGKLEAEAAKGFDIALRAAGKFTNVAAKTIAQSAQESAKALAALTPEQQKQLVDYANLQKLAQLTPEQQKQLVAYAAQAAAPKAASKPAPVPAVKPKLTAATPKTTPKAPQAAAAPAQASRSATSTSSPSAVAPTAAAAPSSGAATYAPYPS